MSSLDCYGNSLIVAYKGHTFDIMNKTNGWLVQRVDMRKTLEGISNIKAIDHVLLPHFKWSDRNIEEVRRND